MAAAWQHNPQGEFHDAVAVHWAAWLSVGASWLGVVGVVSALACRALLLLVDRWARRQRDRSAPGS